MEFCPVWLEVSKVLVRLKSLTCAGIKNAHKVCPKKVIIQAIKGKKSPTSVANRTPWRLTFQAVN